MFFVLRKLTAAHACASQAHANNHERRTAAKRNKPPTCAANSCSDQLESVAKRHNLM